MDNAIKSRDAINIATRHAFDAKCRLVLLLTVLTVGSPPSVGLLGGGRYVVKNFIVRAPGGGPYSFCTYLFSPIRRLGGAMSSADAAVTVPASRPPSRAI